MSWRSPGVLTPGAALPVAVLGGVRRAGRTGQGTRRLHDPEPPPDDHGLASRPPAPQGDSASPSSRRHRRHDRNMLSKLHGKLSSRASHAHLSPLNSYSVTIGLDLDPAEGAARVPEHGSPSIRRRRLAAELRRLRERAGFLGEEAAARLGWSGSKLSRIETSKIGIKQEDLELLLDLYNVSEEHRAEVLALARESAQAILAEEATIASFPAGYAAFVNAEAEAIRRWDWEPQVVPGLLQTKGYAREVMRGWYEMFNLPPTELELRVDARIARQQILNRDKPPELSVVIDESVIRRRFGGSSVMIQQLERLVEFSDLPNVGIQILPLDGDHPIGTGAFTYMQFAQVHDVKFPDIVYVERLNGDYSIEDIGETNKYRVTFERLREKALHYSPSRDLIVSIAREIWS
jgi:transcriptional regulator with XRE-family HTH domain